ncbi:MAG: hypothetical protein NXY57DRAFT_1069295 [Lentinula lateritia]|nr:MAG: hypothetical protein NXY57DRAFT_1069295 [Lentinula lateritia]
MYNEFDTRESAPESIFVDPEEVFGKIFGWERFRAAARTEQVTQLFANLEYKLGIFTQRATGIDDVDVYSASSSPKNLTTLNYDKPSPSTTSPKRTHSSQPTNPPSVSVAGYIAYKANISVRINPSCLPYTQTHIEAAGKAEASHLPSVRNSLEEQPAGKGLQALFKGEELAVESALREVCWEKGVFILPPTVAGGIGTGLGNRDIGSGLGGMFGFRNVLWVDIQPKI